MSSSFTLTELCNQNRPVSLKPLEQWQCLGHCLWMSRMSQCAGDGYYLINRSLNGHLTDQPQALQNWRQSLYYLSSPAVRHGFTTTVWRCRWSPWYGSFTHHVKKIWHLWAREGDWSNLWNIHCIIFVDFKATWWNRNHSYLWGDVRKP